MLARFFSPSGKLYCSVSSKLWRKNLHFGYFQVDNQMKLSLSGLRLTLTLKWQTQTGHNIVRRETLQDKEKQKLPSVSEPTDDEIKIKHTYQTSNVCYGTISDHFRCKGVTCWHFQEDKRVKQKTQPFPAVLHTSKGRNPLFLPWFSTAWEWSEAVKQTTVHNF